jgi:hypothetical protein
VPQAGGRGVSLRYPVKRLPSGRYMVFSPYGFRFASARRHSRIAADPRAAQRIVERVKIEPCPKGCTHLDPEYARMRCKIEEIQTRRAR